MAALTPAFPPRAALTHNGDAGQGTFGINATVVNQLIPRIIASVAAEAGLSANVVDPFGLLHGGMALPTRRCTPGPVGAALSTTTADTHETCRFFCDASWCACCQPGDSPPPAASNLAASRCQQSHRLPLPLPIASQPHVRFVVGAASLAISRRDVVVATRARCDGVHPTDEGFRRIAVSVAAAVGGRTVSTGSGTSLPTRITTWSEVASPVQRASSRSAQTSGGVDAPLRKRKRGDKNGASRTTTSGSLVVFTVSTGGYDVETGSEPRLAKRAMPGVEFLRFVDETSLAKLAGRSSRWQTILLNASDAPGGAGTGAAQRLSRDIKLRPHRYPAIWRHSASIYVDSNVRIHQPLWPIFAKVANGSADLAAYDFGRGLDNEAAWVRRYLIAKSPTFQSAAAQARLNRTLEWQVARYKQHGDHNWNRTMYGKVILRRHTSCARRFGELWWHEYNLGVPRDQLSFRHCIREAGRRCGLEHVSLGRNGRHGPKFYRYFLVHFSQQKGRLAGFR